MIEDERQRGLGWRLAMLAAALGWCSGACTASGQANAKLSTRISLDGPAKGDDFDRVKALDAIDQDERTQSLGEHALLGARHDLELKGSSKPSCGCVRVALGEPSNPAFAWQEAPPVIDTSTQLVFAMTSKGVTCAGEPEGSKGASYEGYVLESGNVIVRLEDARQGPPVTSGAIIPRPDAGSFVYVKPYKKELPYGRSLAGDGPCRVWGDSPKSGG